MSDLRSKICAGEIDINNIDLFFSGVIKGAIWWMNQNVKIRDEFVPHYIISTGDDIMYKELLGYCYNTTGEVTGEDFIYSRVPRCIVDVGGFSTKTDQLTQPYARGIYEVEYEDNLREFSAELQSLPMEIELSLKYYVDSFTDSLSLIQYIFTHITYVQLYHISYMGQDVACSMQLPDSSSIEKQIEVDFNSENRSRMIELSIVIETAMPIYNNKSSVETSCTVGEFDVSLNPDYIS